MEDDEYWKEVKRGECWLAHYAAIDGFLKH